MTVQQIARERFSIPIVCPGCGQTGAALWEENAGRVRPKRQERTLLLVSQGFHPMIARMQSGDPRIVCDICGSRIED